MKKALKMTMENSQGASFGFRKVSKNSAKMILKETFLDYENILAIVRDENLNEVGRKEIGRKSFVWL